MHNFKKIALVIACGAAMSTAIAQPAKSEKQAKRAIELRQSVFKLLGSNMGPIGAMAKGKIDMNTDVVAKNAERIGQLSLMIEDYLKTDTSKFDIKTDAKAKIWNNKKDFLAKAGDLTKASAALSAAVKTGDEGQIKKAIGGVGKTCGSCHDDYKQK